MKTIRKAVCGLAIGMVAINLLPAQEMATPDQSIQSLTDLNVMLQALEATTPMPAASLPRAATFWSAQHAPGSPAVWPPLPSNFGLSAWPLGDGVYLLNDTNVNYAELAAAAEAAKTSAAASSRMSMSMMAQNLAGYAYGNPVYLTNVAAIPDGYGNMIASFNIAGGTNFVPYDILTTTNLTTPVANWNWLGLGYTSNHYTFHGQPTDWGFYLLAKPSKTMVVPWGDDTYGQCDLWSGITNALQVTGGIEFSLALLNNGTVVGWGYDGASSSELVPTNLIGVTMITSGWQFNVALLTNGTVTAWGADIFGELDVPTNLINVTVISAQALNTLALCSNGTVVAWGDDDFGQCDVPSGLTNVTAIAAGGEHSLAVSNGIVVAWGDNAYGQCDVPAGLSNVVDVAASGYHSLALLNTGRVVAWGDDSYGETNVPAGLSNVVMIAAGGDSLLADPAPPYSLALKSDGTVVAWGSGDVLDPVEGLTNVISIGGGVYHALAVRTGPATPVITLEPTDEYQVAGGNATFTARGAGLYGVTYQWQTNGVNLSGATNATLTLTNVQAAQLGVYDVVVTDNAGMGSLVSSNANLYLVTPPVITYQSQPTNLVTIYGKYVSFAATASSPYQANGFPLSYRWQFDGTNIAGATSTNYSFTANDTNSGVYTFIASNAAGSTNVSWQVTLTNAIDVTQDLLLIYNTNSADSTTVLNYYLAHRPMVSGANVLGIGCVTNEITTSANFTNQILTPYLNWLTNNPGKHPQYLVLFPDIPSRVEDTIIHPSVQYQLYSETPNGQPFVTSINMNGTNDCIAYINKLAYIGTNYSPDQLVISASAGGYGNTNWYFDDTRDSTNYGTGPNLGSLAESGVLSVDPNASITYTDMADNGTLEGDITNGFNVAGYLSWGFHSALGSYYATNGYVQWLGNSGWWIIETVESFNGQRNIVGPSTGSNFLAWYSSNAFGGTNYSNTPIGAVTHVEEPGLSNVENSSIYFGLWAAGENFAICAWSSRQTIYFQAVGDPFVIR